jgi:hypothetical protein
MMDILNILEIVTSVVGVLSVVASLTPNPVDNAILLGLNKALNIGAFNIGKAKNKD